MGDDAWWMWRVMFARLSCRSRCEWATRHCIRNLVHWRSQDGKIQSNCEKWWPGSFWVLWSQDWGHILEKEILVGWYRSGWRWNHTKLWKCAMGHINRMYSWVLFRSVRWVTGMKCSTKYLQDKNKGSNLWNIEGLLLQNMRWIESMMCSVKFFCLMATNKYCSDWNVQWCQQTVQKIVWW